MAAERAGGHPGTPSHERYTMHLPDLMPGTSGTAGPPVDLPPTGLPSWSRQVATAGSIRPMSAEPVPPSADEPSVNEEGLDEQARSRLVEVLTNVDRLRDLGKASPVVQDQLTRLAAALTGRAEEPEPHLRLVGRARKVSVSMPEDLATAVQQRVGRGEFSQYVTEAVTRQLELDLLGELSALLQAEHGPVSEEALAEARHSWPDTQ